MKDLDYNLHSHTFRCGHAEGEDEEYVLAAIKQGFTHMGFSDHVFLPGIFAPRMRGDISMLDDYVNSVKRLREKYKGKIDIHLGFEAEYMKEFAHYYKHLLDDGIIDYLIMGQHCYYKDGKTYWYTSGTSTEEAVKHYTDDLIEGMRSGLFLYVAHPDFFMLYSNYFEPYHEEASRRIAKAAKELDIPLEINVSKARRYPKGEFNPKELLIYPYPPFWEIVGQEGCKVVFGVDAHSPSHYQTADYDTFLKLVKDYDLNLIRHCPLD